MALNFVGNWAVRVAYGWGRAAGLAGGPPDGLGDWAGTQLSPRPRSCTLSALAACWRDGLASRRVSRTDQRQRLLEQGVVRTSAAATQREFAKDPSGRRSAQARARRATRANHRTRAIGRSECCACRRCERRTRGTSKVGLRAWCGVLARGLSTGRLCRDQGRWVL